MSFAIDYYCIFFCILSCRLHVVCLWHSWPGLGREAHFWENPLYELCRLQEEVWCGGVWKEVCRHWDFQKTQENRLILLFFWNLTDGHKTSGQFSLVLFALLSKIYSGRWWEEAYYLSFSVFCLHKLFFFLMVCFQICYIFKSVFKSFLYLVLTSQLHLEMHNTEIMYCNF